jgi:signal transduction histidine kinase
MISGIRKWVAFSTLLLLWTSALFAQYTYDYYPKYYNKQNNQISENIISDLMLDENNKLWIATPNGLFQFNGTEVEPYPTAIPERIASLFRTKDYQILISCVDRKIYRVNNDSFELYFDFSTSDLPPFDNMLLSGNKAFSLKLATKLQDSLRDTRALFSSSDNTIFFRKKNMVYTYKNNQYNRIHKSDQGSKHDLFFNNKYWLLDDKTGISVCVNDVQLNNIALPFNPQLIGKARWFIDYQLPPLVILENKAWVLSKINATGQYEWRFLTAEVPTDVAIYNALYSGDLDKLFIGTLANGLIVFSKSNFSVYQHKIPKNNFSFYQYYSQIPLKNGDIITDFPNQLTNVPQGFRGFFKDAILNFSHHRLNENIIFGSTNKFYFTLDLNTLSPKRIAKKQVPKGQSQSFIEYKNQLYVLNASGIFIYNPQSDSITPRIETPIGYGIINQSMVINNQIWLAYCGGLLVYDPKTNSIVKRIQKPTCFRYFFRYKNKIIITTYGEGLYLIDSAKQTLSSINNDYYKALKRTHFLYQDKNKFIWASTNDGLIRIPSISFDNALAGGDFIPQPQYFDYTNGLPTDEMNGGTYPAFLNFNDTMLSIPSLMGIVKFHPIRDFPPRKTNPKLVIKEVASLGKKLNLSNGNLILSSKMNEVQFRLQTTFWDNPKNLNLYYRLDSKLTYIPYAQLNNLNLIIENSGEHQITFLYIDDQGVENRIQTISILKEKPWYLRSFSLIIIGTLILILTGFVSWIRTKRVEFQNLKLKKIIDEKTIEIQAINTELMQKVAALTTLDSKNNIYISVINHDIFAPIKYINIVGDKIHANQSKLRKQDIVDHFNLIINSTKRLELLCSNILNERSSGTSFHHINHKISVFSLLNELKAFIRVGLRINNNELTIKVAKNISVSTSLSALNIILTNLLGNANRFTKNGQITVSFQQKDNLNYFIIKDTGNGMNEEMMQKIKTRTLEVNHKDGSEYQSYGIGYSLIFKMLDIIHGHLEIESKPLKGTAITVVFPNLEAIIEA